MFRLTRGWQKNVQLRKIWMTMKLTTFLLIFTLTHMMASETYSQATKLTLQLRDVTVKEVLNQIEEKSEFFFLYNSKLVNVNRKVNVDAKNERIDDLLSSLFPEKEVDFAVVDRQIILSPKQDAYKIVKQQQKITGTVTDAINNEPIIGANVVVEGTTIGVITDIKGKFTLDILTKDAVIIISYIGYNTEKMAINGQTSVEIKLIPDITKLDEIVVIGYGSVKKGDLTGAVSSLKIKEAKTQTFSSLDQMFQGKVSGVIVTQGSYAPGGGINVRVRGTNSINGGSGEPLYVVDGVPLVPFTNQVSTENPYAPNAPNLNTLSLINQNDIESIDILKDASSTAIYGARGANGVVLITTKRGKKGESKIDFSANYGVATIAKRYDMLNARQFMELNNDARNNSTPAASYPIIFSDSIMNTIPYDTDWQNELYRQGVIQDYNLSFSGGNDKTSYLLGVGYLNNKGIIKGTGQTRYNLRLNLDNQATKRIKVGINLNLSRSEMGIGNTDGGNLVQNTLRMVPIGPKQFDNYYFNNEYDVYNNYYINSTTLRKYSDAGITSIFPSPLYNAEAVTSQQISHKIFGVLYGELKILPYLTFRTQLGTDLMNGRTEYFEPRNGSIRATGGAAVITASNTMSITDENRLTFSQIWEKHNLTVTAAQETQFSRYETLLGRGEGLSGITTVYNLAGNTMLSNVASSNGRESTIASFIGRLNYGYDNRYLITATARRDGSSNFSKNKKWATFYSGALSWKVTNEKIMESLARFMSLTARISYGQVGNQSTGSYNSLNTIGTTAVIFSQPPAALSYRTNQGWGNPDLSWESTSSMNYGLDMGFLKNRLSLTVEYYKKNTKDLLFSRTLPASSGYSSITDNIGSVSNEGIDVSVTSYNFTGAFSWNTSIIFSKNINKITALQNGNRDQTTGNIIQRVGEPVSSYYGYVTDGIFQTGEPTFLQTKAVAGERRYKDINSDGKIDANDRVVLGNSTPEINCGLTNTFSYKGVELEVFFTGAFKSHLYNQTQVALENLNGRFNSTTSVLNRWTPDNGSTTMPMALQMNSGNNYGSSLNDLYVEDNSFIRLKTVALSYSIPSKFLQAAKIRGIRVGVSGQNLWTSTKYRGFDPEVSGDNGAYPSAKVVNFNVNLSF